MYAGGIGLSINARKIHLFSIHLSTRINRLCRPLLASDLRRYGVFLSVRVELNLTVKSDMPL